MKGCVPVDLIEHTFECRVATIEGVMSMLPFVMTTTPGLPGASV
jgi:hypothetical protein